MPDAYLVPVLTLVLGAGGMGGLWACLAERAKGQVAAPAAMAASVAALQVAVNTAAEKMMAECRQEIAELKAEVAELKAEREEVRGENAQLAQRIISLENLLRRHGIDIPRAKLAGSLLIIEGDHAQLQVPQSVSSAS